MPNPDGGFNLTDRLLLYFIFGKGFESLREKITAGEVMKMVLDIEVIYLLTKPNESNPNA